MGEAANDIETFSCPALVNLPSVNLAAADLSGIYFIQRGKAGAIKIGWSKSIRSRLATLQTAHHEDLRLLLVLAGQPEDERRLHEWFGKERLKDRARAGSEWFRPDGEVARFIALTLENRGRLRHRAECDCNGSQWGGFCWGEITYYGDGDYFCDGHLAQARGHGWLRPPAISGLDVPTGQQRIHPLGEGASKDALTVWEKGYDGALRNKHSIVGWDKVSLHNFISGFQLGYDTHRSTCSCGSSDRTPRDAGGMLPHDLDPGSFTADLWARGYQGFLTDRPYGVSVNEETATAAGRGYIAGYKHGEDWGRAQMAGDGFNDGYRDGWRDAADSSSQVRSRIDSLLDILGGDQ